VSPEGRKQDWKGKPLKDLIFQRVMVVFAHPDDAEVQCAGTVARWIEDGKTVTYVILTRGDKGTQDPGMTQEALAELRREEQLRAAQELGVKKVLFLENGDGELEVTLERRRVLARIIRQHQPEVLITHDPWMRYQLHPDHRASGTLALDAMISARDRLYFPDQIDQGLQPCRVRWVDIESTFEKKIKALGQHRSQVSQWPNWEGWLRRRAENAGSSQGLKLAEPFKLLVVS